jgi:hypothetical protein
MFAHRYFSAHYWPAHFFGPAVVPAGPIQPGMMLLGTVGLRPALAGAVAIEAALSAEGRTVRALLGGEIVIGGHA